MGLTTRHHRTPSQCSITTTDHHGGWDVVEWIWSIYPQVQTQIQDNVTPLFPLPWPASSWSASTSTSPTTTSNDRDKYISRLLKCYGVSNLTLSSVLNFYCDHINTSTSNTSLKYFVLLGSRLCHPLLPIVLLSRSLSPVISATNSHHDDEQLPVSPLSDDTMVSLPSVPIYLRTVLWARPESNNQMWYRSRILSPALTWPWVSKSVYPCAGDMIQALVRWRTSWHLDTREIIINALLGLYWH